MNDEQVMHAMSIDDMYRVERVLARGAGGVTELVTIDGAGPFVRKKIPNRLANQGVWSLIESCGCARLPKVEATYSLPDQFVVVYDFVPGQTLEELVVAKKRLVPEEAASLAADICEAAAALHSRGVVHRDLSPRNVIVAADGAHLIDLGIARMRVEGASRDTTSLGTRGFASPEQYGFAQTDARSDVYAIGKLLGYMLTGLQPDGDEYERALGDADATDSRLAEVVARACAFEPSSRYQSAAEMARALGRSVGAEVCAPGGGGASPGARAAATWTRKGLSKKAIVIAIAAVLLAVGLVFFFVLGSGKEGHSVSAGSGGAAVTPTSTTSAEPGAVSVDDLPLKIAEYGWSVDSMGYVHAVVGLQNTSENMAVDMPIIRVTGYDAAGAQTFTEEQGAMVCLPGQVSYIYVQSTAEAGTTARVEVALEAGATTKERRVTTPISLDVSDVSAKANSFGGLTITGSVSLSSDGSWSRSALLSNAVMLTSVLRDDAGRIVGGTTDFLTTVPAAGESAPFSITDYAAPDYATVEVHAQPW